MHTAVVRLTTAALTAGIGLASFVLWRVCATRRARWSVLALGVYGVSAFAYGAWAGLPVRAVLAGPGFSAIPRVLQSAAVGAFLILPLGWIAAVVQAGGGILRRGARGPVYQALALTLCVALVAASIPWKPSTVSSRPANQTTTASRPRVLSDSLRAIEDGERDAPRDRWDEEYVAEKLGRDPVQIIRWVRDNTFWIPYVGVLRCPVGVLMDGQGNALDRSLLLATLLERSGVSVRLAHGQLPRADAVRLLPFLVGRRADAFARAARAHRAAPVDVPGAARGYGLDASAVARTIAEQRSALRQTRQELQSRIATQAHDLLQRAEHTSRLGRSGEWPRRRDEAIGALTDYWWVEASNGRGWIDIDLTAAGEASGVALPPVLETLSLADLGSRPVFHQITVRVIAERASAHGRSEYTVLEHTLRPSELIGESIALQFWPGNLEDGTSDSRAQRPRKPLPGQPQEWTALLVVGERTVAAGILNDTGVDPEAPQKAADLGSLADAFGDSMGQHRSDAGTLSAVWIEYELTGPGRTKRTERRMVFDLLGTAARAAGRHAVTLDAAGAAARAAAMTMRTELLPLVCDLAPEFVVHLASRALLGNRALLEAAIRPGPDAAFGAAIEAAVGPTVSPLYVLALERSEWTAEPAAFVDRPVLYTRHLYPGSDGTSTVLYEATDIVFNGTGVALDASDAFSIRTALGVLETNGEAMLHPRSQRSGNAGDAFAASQDWMTLEPGSSLDDLRLPPDVRQRIADDLAAGYLVVAPREPVPDGGAAPFAGWWRIDPLSGDSLGFGPTGWGQSATERAAQLRRRRAVFEAFKRAGKRFASAFATTYGWCVAPIVSSELERKGLKLGVVEAALASSPDECMGISVFVAGLVTLPLLVLPLEAAEAASGVRAPRVPPESVPEPPSAPAEPPPPCPGEAPISPQAESVKTPVASPVADIEEPVAPSKEAATAGSPKPVYAPYHASPLSPEEFQQYRGIRASELAEAEQNLARAEADYKGAQQNYENADQAADAAKQRYMDLQASGADEATKDDAFVKNVEAQRRVMESQNTLNDAYTRVSKSSASAAKARIRDAYAREIEQPNAKLYEAQQRYLEASDNFQKWRQGRSGGYCSPAEEARYDEWFREERRWSQAQSEFWKESMRAGEEAKAAGRNASQPGADRTSFPDQPPLSPKASTQPGLDKTDLDPLRHSGTGGDRTQYPAEPPVSPKAQTQPGLDKTDLDPLRHSGSDQTQFPNQPPVSPKANTQPGLDKTLPGGPAPQRGSSPAGGLDKTQPANACPMPPCQASPLAATLGGQASIANLLGGGR